MTFEALYQTPPIMGRSSVVEQQALTLYVARSSRAASAKAGVTQW